MILRLAIIAIGLGLLSSGQDGPNGQRVLERSQTLPATQDSAVPWEIERLKIAYPNAVKSIDEEFIHWYQAPPTNWKEVKDLLLRHFSTPPSFDELMRSHPIRRFSTELVASVFESNEGRSTFYEILQKMYGQTPREVDANLRFVRFMPRTLNLRFRFNTQNGAADALEAVGRELDRLPASYHRYLARSTTYINRNIRGSQVKSLHSLGIAIDINPRYGDYWRWTVQANGQLTQVPRNRIPMEIVRIFEKHGFLWGGRWYFYDTIHFEYRPELFLDRKTP